MAAEKRLISYIALGAPATRRPAEGDEPFLRAELGFTPRWYRENLDIDFGARWHTEPIYREDALRRMAREVQRRFPHHPIGQVSPDGEPLDLLTGAYGAALVAAFYGMPILYAPDNWPTNERRFLSDAEARALEPPDLRRHPLFEQLQAQIEWIARRLGRVRGYINWQGVLNNAMRIRGEAIFEDMLLRPDLARRVFDCVAATMSEGARLCDRLRPGGAQARHFTVSNCAVNMISPRQYREFLLPFDRRFAEEFGLLGIHNCAWNATPYLEEYAKAPSVGYIDMGLDSDLARAKALFPNARRALMYTPMDLKNKDIVAIRRDLERLACEYAPCDVVLADIEAGTPDRRVEDVLGICRALARTGADKVSGDTT